MKCSQRRFESFIPIAGKDKENIVYVCDKDMGHFGLHRQRINKTEYYAWPNFPSPGEKKRQEQAQQDGLM
jgi:hypothetical protein